MEQSIVVLLSTRMWWTFLAPLSVGHESLCHGAAYVIRLSSSTVSFKRLLLKNYWANFNQSWWMGIQICSNKGPIRCKIRKFFISIQKSSSHEPMVGMHWYLAWIIHGARRFKFVQIKSLGSCMAHHRGLNFYIVIYREMLKNLLKNH